MLLDLYELKYKYMPFYIVVYALIKPTMYIMYIPLRHLLDTMITALKV